MELIMSNSGSQLITQDNQLQGTSGLHSVMPYCIYGLTRVREVMQTHPMAAKMAKSGTESEEPQSYHSMDPISVTNFAHGSIYSSETGMLYTRQFKCNRDIHTTGLYYFSCAPNHCVLGI